MDMQTVEWDPSYSVGDDEIDAQHRRLLEVINRLGHLIAGPAGRTELSPQDIFDELARYVTSHFAYEESRMLEAGFPPDKAQAHRAEHDKLLKDLQAFEAHMESGDPEVMKELLPFLYGDWLINHICVADAQFAPYLARQQADAQAPR